VNYFSKFEKLTKNEIERLSIDKRRNRKLVEGFFNIRHFVSGDIIDLIFKRRGLTFTFQGICLAVRKKNLGNVNASFILRNVLSGIGIELIILYYYNRVYKFFIHDFKRKDFGYRQSKLYYLRNRLNRETRVK